MLAVVAAVSLTACSSSGSSGGKDAGAPPKASAVSSAARPSSPTGHAAPGAAADVRIVKAGFEDDPYLGPHMYFVHYAITNHATAAADYYVEVELLDADGDHLGTMTLSAEKLWVGKTKTSEERATELNVENGKIADIRSVRVSEVQRTPAA
ncbi:hypothetical protein VSR01_16375 [Actinacidiphila sp. DG2A-62]|uniref:hypothetical protein n=1 Tax=Actinacidiphila sp. DG2A-62 TaxID=3108821 RepID=UPI002DB8EB7F|nr:hypothetical protein [Actinacidiphila sp. DG2A-62]MEC3995022.1 hypothetical protein [Actinacidiphila sp. DG2A-62]